MGTDLTDTAIYDDFIALVDKSPGTDWYYALGMAGEAGEVAEKIKKKHRDEQFDKENLLLELGDVLWYVTRMAHFHGYTLDDVIRGNMQKLQSRRERNMLHGSGDTR